MVNAMHIFSSSAIQKQLPLFYIQEYINAHQNPTIMTFTPKY